jgi:hypothetical protein
MVAVGTVVAKTCAKTSTAGRDKWWELICQNILSQMGMVYLENRLMKLCHRRYPL